MSLITPEMIGQSRQQFTIHQVVELLVTLPDVYDALSEAKDHGTSGTIKVKQGFVRNDGGPPLVLELTIQVREEDEGEEWS